MYPKYIEVHLRNQGAEAGDQIIVNVEKITVIRDGVVETEREGIEVTETYDELKALFKGCGCLIYNADQLNHITLADLLDRSLKTCKGR